MFIPSPFKEQTSSTIFCNTSCKFVLVARTVVLPHLISKPVYITHEESNVSSHFCGVGHTANGARRDAWYKALGELILANTAFLWANDYALFHRYKYELKYTV